MTRRSFVFENGFTIQIETTVLINLLVKRVRAYLRSRRTMHPGRAAFLAYCLSPSLPSPSSPTPSLPMQRYASRRYYNQVHGKNRDIFFTLITARTLFEISQLSTVVVRAYVLQNFGLWTFKRVRFEVRRKTRTISESNKVVSKTFSIVFKNSISPSITYQFDTERNYSKRRYRHTSTFFFRVPRCFESVPWLSQFVQEYYARRYFFVTPMSTEYWVLLRTKLEKLSLASMHPPCSTPTLAARVIFTNF